MTGKNFLVVSLRLFVVGFSIKFIRDAFYRWDGYSFYLTFKEVAPDFAIAYIIWILLGALLALGFWLATFAVPLLLPKRLRFVRYEHLTAWFIAATLLLIIKKISGITLTDLSELFGVHRFLVLGIACIVLTLTVWLGRRHIERNIERIVLSVNAYMTPLVWVCVILLVVSVFCSIQLSFRDTEDRGRKNESFADQKAENKKPNILLVSYDAMPAENMQVYGYDRPTTPFLSQWSREAVLFMNAHSSGNWTPPSTMTMMTGQRPWTHRNVHLTYLYPFRNYKNNLPRLMKQAGYATYAFVQNVNAHPNSLGISKWFDLNIPYDDLWTIPEGWVDIFQKVKFFLEHKLRSPIAAKWIMEHPIMFLLGLNQPDAHVTQLPVEKVYNRFFKEISQKSERPFFAWIHMEPPHIPFLPPAPFMGMFGDSDKFNSYNKQEFLFGLRYDKEMQGKIDIVKKRLDEFIAYCDYQFELFISQIPNYVDMSNTVVIFTTDHGTSLDRGYVGHGAFELYENVTHIPLIIKLPWQNGGRNVEFPVEQVDLAPTILDIAGISIPDWMEGRSLLPLINGATFEERPIFSMEIAHNQALGHLLDRNKQISIAVWFNGFKLINYFGWKDKPPELYNLTLDPEEMTNLYSKNKKISKELQNMMDYFIDLANERILTASNRPGTN